MNPLTTRKSLVNLKQYDIVLTTSFEFKHGISGHLFEMVEYYYAIKTFTHLTPCILLSDGTTLQELNDSVKQKYDMEPIENVVVAFQPKVILANDILITDGSFRMKDCELLVNKVYLFRCSESDFSWFKNPIILQDHDVYGDEHIHYKKKLLFDKFKKIDTSVKDTAMFYLSTNCRALAPDKVNELIDAYKFDNNVILTNDTEYYKDVNANVMVTPVEDIFSLFSTYIYTAIPRQLDCSPRFILECKHYNKEVIYDIDYMDKGLEVRRTDDIDMLNLTKDDYFIQLLNE